jgi:hypothetical protein
MLFVIENIHVMKKTWNMVIMMMKWRRMRRMRMRRWMVFEWLS